MVTISCSIVVKQPQKPVTVVKQNESWDFFNPSFFWFMHLGTFLAIFFKIFLRQPRHFFNER